jgi:peptidoglycan-associated lipoprotein
MINKYLSIALIAFIAASCSSNLKKTSAENEIVKSEIKKEEPEKMTVWFDTNKYALTEDALKILEKEILPEIKEAKNAKVTVEGHCDERGTIAYNKKLGKNRANAVKSYLVKNGVKATKIKTVSFGKSKPVDVGHNENAWSKNRRAVTIIIENK